MGVLIVTGTRSGVGKTVAAAAIAACAPGVVAVVKPAQTGCADTAPGDIGEIVRLARIDAVHEFARYPDALPPHHAAMLSGRPALPLAECVRRIVDLDAVHDLVIVDGTGGLHTPFDSDGRWTLIDLAHAVDGRFVAVLAVGPDMISDTAAIVAAVDDQGLEPPAIVVGAWPAEPDEAARLGVFDVAAMAPHRALAGVLPAGLAAGGNFRRRARAALAPDWGGTLDSRAFVSRQRL